MHRHRQSLVDCPQAKATPQILSPFIPSLKDLGFTGFSDKAVDAHNKSIRSLNRTVFPHTRRLEDRGITKGKDIPQIDELAVHPETLAAPELAQTPRLEASD